MKSRPPPKVLAVFKTCVSFKNYATRYIFINYKSMNQFHTLCMKKVLKEMRT